MVLPALHGAWSDTHLLSPHRLPQTPRRQLRPMRDGQCPRDDRQMSFGGSGVRFTSDHAVAPVTPPPRTWPVGDPLWSYATWSQCEDWYTRSASDPSCSRRPDTRHLFSRSRLAVCYCWSPPTVEMCHSLSSNRFPAQLHPSGRPTTAYDAWGVDHQSRNCWSSSS